MATLTIYDELGGILYQADAAGFVDLIRTVRVNLQPGVSVDIPPVVEDPGVFVFFVWGDFQGVDLSGEDLWRMKFNDTNLAGADLSGCDARGSDFNAASLVGTDFTGADLRGADLHDCDVTGADFTNADLRGALLYRTNLDGATLTGANLEGADLDGPY